MHEILEKSSVVSAPVSAARRAAPPPAKGQFTAWEGLHDATVGSRRPLKTRMFAADIFAAASHPSSDT